jgi:hypothetical protein
VVWDYHVILVLKPKPSLGGSNELNLETDADRETPGDKKNTMEDGEAGVAWVYDFDTSITPVPCQWSGALPLITKSCCH